MEKIIVLNEDVKVLIKLKEVDGFSSETACKENLHVLGMMVYFKGKSIVKDAINIMPETIIGKELKELYLYNGNYLYGTNKQMNVLDQNNKYVDPTNLKSITDAIELLKVNGLYEDRGVCFGKKSLIKPLPINIINLAKKIVA